MNRIKKKAIIDENYCVACGTCTKVCPLQIIKIEHGIFAKVNLEKCVGCAKCAKACPASVIEIKSYEECNINEKK